MSETAPSWCTENQPTHKETHTPRVKKRRAGRQAGDLLQSQRLRVIKQSSCLFHLILYSTAMPPLLCCCCVAFQFAFLPLFSSDCEINLLSLRLLLQRCAKQKHEGRRCISRRTFKNDYRIRQAERERERESSAPWRLLTNCWIMLMVDRLHQICLCCCCLWRVCRDPLYI